MVRLRREDFDDPEALARLARAVGQAPEAFRARYGYLVANEAAPVALTDRRPFDLLMAN
jgi:6-phosphofructokinase 1